MHLKSGAFSFYNFSRGGGAAGGGGVVVYFYVLETLLLRAQNICLIEKT